MRCLKQTQIQHPSELLEEVEADSEGSCDVEEVQRNPGLLVQPCGENSVEDNFLERTVRGDQDPWRGCCRTAPTWESDASTAKDTAAPGTG